MVLYSTLNKHMNTYKNINIELSKDIKTYATTLLDSVKLYNNNNIQQANIKMLICDDLLTEIINKVNNTLNNNSNVSTEEIDIELLQVVIKQTFQWGSGKRNEIMSMSQIIEIIKKDIPKINNKHQEIIMDILKQNNYHRAIGKKKINGEISYFIKLSNWNQPEIFTYQNNELTLANAL